MKNVFNWGIIGLGKIADKFASDLPHSENGVLHAVASRSIAKATEFAKRHGVSHMLGSYEEILAVPSLDAVYIATPHNLHFENTMMCIEAGIPVLCEKPFAINLNQSEQMVALAREKNVFLMDALWTRFLPHFIEIKKIVDSGVLGPITSLKADFGFEANKVDHKRLFNKNLGGGALLDIGIYPIFASYALLGKPTEILAKAEFGDTGVDIKVDVEFKYGNTCKADLTCSLLENTPSNLFIEGEWGILEVGHRFFAPNNYDLRIRDKNRKTSNFKYNCNGYKYEADVVSRCISRGQTESNIMPLDFTVELMHLLDQVRRKAGIFYLKYDV